LYVTTLECIEILKKKSQKNNAIDCFCGWGLLCNFTQNKGFFVLSIQYRAETYLLWDAAIIIIPSLFKVVPNEGKIVNPSNYPPSSIFPSTFMWNKQANMVHLVYTNFIYGSVVCFGILWYNSMYVPRPRLVYASI
jgi:hypothetical protein